MRAIPNLTVIRPADANEASEAWGAILEDIDGPVCLVLSRQDVADARPDSVSRRRSGLRRGAYVADGRRSPDVVLVGDRRRGRDRARRPRPARREGHPGARRLDAELGALRGAGPPTTATRSCRPECRRSPSRLARPSAGRAGSTTRSGSTRFGASGKGAKVLEHFGISPAAVAAARRRDRSSSPSMKVSVGFTPGEQISAPVGVVIDVLRATSTICQALAAGYRARDVRRRGRARRARSPARDVALAGERAERAARRVRLRQLAARVRRRRRRRSARSS